MQYLILGIFALGRLDVIDAHGNHGKVMTRLEMRCSFHSCALADYLLNAQIS